MDCEALAMYEQIGKKGRKSAARYLAVKHTLSLTGMGHHYYVVVYLLALTTNIFLQLPVEHMSLVPDMPLNIKHWPLH